jgi:UDPglucose--hexose-1-phosphate uridylyltransferase
VAEESEMRQNAITREWTLFAPVRGRRPHDPQRFPAGSPQRGRYEPGCPFCPGNEAQLPPVITEMPAVEDLRPWQTRVVQNKFPVLTSGAVAQWVDRGTYAVMGARGRHEVLIESARHDDDLPEMSLEAVLTVIETYHQRYLAALEGEAVTLLFRNRGPGAGASLGHPHSQLIAPPIVPPRIQRREAAARDFHDQHGRCGYCALLAQEMAEGERVVLTNEWFVAFVPYAAETPFETWLMPRRHAADFGAIAAEEKAGLASALREVLRRLSSQAGNPDYNLIVRTATRSASSAPFLHWYVQIRPRVALEAGFEIESGMHINTSLPEMDAALLRGDAL